MIGPESLEEEFPREVTGHPAVAADLETETGTGKDQCLLEEGEVKGQEKEGQGPMKGHMTESHQDLGQGHCLLRDQRTDLMIGQGQIIVGQSQMIEVQDQVQGQGQMRGQGEEGQNQEVILKVTVDRKTQNQGHPVVKGRGPKMDNQKLVR